MKSKAMKNLLAELVDVQAEATEINNKADVTVEELNAVKAKLTAVRAKIDNQSMIDEGKKFDPEGLEIPVNEPVKPDAKTQAKPFRSFGEQLQAIARSAKQGATIDHRLLEIQNATGASEGVPSEGGFLVQQDFQTELIQYIHDNSVLASKCRKIKIGANANGVKLLGIDETSRADGYRWGGVTAEWVEEGGTVTASKPKFRKIELELKKIMALGYATDELLQDAATLESVMMPAFKEEISFLTDDSLISGDGSGKPLGFLNSGALVTQAKESGQAADTILHENISNMWNRMLARFRSNAIWVINQECEPHLENLVLSMGTGGMLSPYAQEYMLKGTLKGRPVIPIEQASAIGDLGDISLVDMNQYLLADKNSVQTASSMHVMFNYDEMVFRVIYRVDGQPAFNSPLTPYKGTSGRTLGAFVTLQAR